MGVRTIGLLLICLPALTGMRDPFQAPQIRCPDGKAGQWRYAGIVNGPTTLAIVRDENARWLRVRAGDNLPTGWRVAAVNEHEMVVDALAGCEPRLWRWPREGTKK